MTTAGDPCLPATHTHTQTHTHTHTHTQGWPLTPQMRCLQTEQTNNCWQTHKKVFDWINLVSWTLLIQTLTFILTIKSRMAAVLFVASRLWPRWWRGLELTNDPSDNYMQHLNISAHQLGCRTDYSQCASRAGGLDISGATPALVLLHRTVKSTHHWLGRFSSGFEPRPGSR